MLGGGAYLLTGLTRFAEIHSAKGRFSGPGFDWQGEFWRWASATGDRPAVASCSARRR